MKLMAALCVGAASAVSAATLPELNKIKTHSFSKAYSCGGSYADSGLALGSTSQPDILFNGACSSTTEFDVSFAGADFGLISLLGPSADFALENVTAHAAFNFANAKGQANQFASSAPAKPHSTYAILRTESPGSAPSSSVRTLFAVETQGNCGHADATCDIRYAVLDYTLVTATAQSPGFNWTQPNSE